MVTANTRTVTILEEVLDLSVLGWRLSVRVPDAVAGPVVVVVRRMSGWASEAVLVRRLVDGTEVAIGSGVSAAAPVSPVESVRLRVDDARAGDVWTIGADDAEAGKVAVTVRAVVAADGLGVRTGGATGGVSGISDVPGLVDALAGKRDIPGRSRMVVIEEEFLQSNANAFAPGLLGASAASGTIAAAAGAANHPGCLDLRDSTTANATYRIMTDVSAFLLAGGEACTFVFQDRNTTTRATSAFRMGFQDSTAVQTAPVDGVYFNVAGGVATGRCRSNSSQTDTSTTYTLTENTWYTATIAINAAGTLATFTIYNESGTQVWTDTVATNIPTGASRFTGWGVLAGETSTDAAAAIVRMDYMSLEIGRVLVR